MVQYYNKDHKMQFLKRLEMMPEERRKEGTFSMNFISDCLPISHILREEMQITIYYP